MNKTHEFSMGFSFETNKPYFWIPFRNDMSLPRHDWTQEGILAIYNRPLMQLLYDAATVHREYHDPNTVQVSTLLSIKTGGCPEDCGYCPQAARYHTNVEGNDLMSVQQVKAQALRAKASGSSRVCMGCLLYTSPSPRDS